MHTQRCCQGSKVLMLHQPGARFAGQMRIKLGCQPKHYHTGSVPGLTCGSDSRMLISTTQASCRSSAA